ncbi:hypothetical protein IFM89_002724, partial [Coptis chinensis]
MARKSSISSSSSNNHWRYIHSYYYLKRPKRLAFLFISFVFLTFFIWDRQSLIREHEAEMTKLSQDLLPLQNQLQEFKSASGETMITNVLKDDPVDVQRRGKVKETMLHAWTCYENYAWGQDELQTKNGVNSFGGLGATLIDSLDTLYIMGLDEQFQRARDDCTAGTHIVVRGRHIK